MSVVLIMGIVAGVIISRVARVDDMELAAQVNSIRNHIRYAQIMAMKRNDLIWGLKCDGSLYWLFKTSAPEVATEPDETSNMVYLPGHGNAQISMPAMDAFTLYFDKYGIPYEYDDSGPGEITKRTAHLPIHIGAKTLTVTMETGFVE